MSGKYEASLGDQYTTGDMQVDPLVPESELEAIDPVADVLEEVISLGSRYEMQGLLGRGGMGEVFRAIDKRLMRPVAIKRLHGSQMTSRGMAARFISEAQAVAALTHYNIVRIYDFGRSEDGYFLVMELVEGESLDQVLRREKKLDSARVASIIGALCDALQVAHATGIIHRDIKPANILLTKDGVPKLTDFGLARQDGETDGRTQAGVVLGTIDFMSPEQRRDARKVDARSDIWSLAATAYQLVTGASPRIIRADRIPEAWREPLLRALEDNPDDRFPSAAAFGEAIQEAVTDVTERSFQAKQGLVPGQCGSCKHRNGTDQEYCVKCGEPLYDPCLKCGHRISDWAVFCAGCGANAAQELERKGAEFQHEREQIELLRQRFQHREAIERLKKLVDNKHSAFREFFEWKKLTEGSLLVELDALERDALRLGALARERLAVGDEQDAIHLLDQIPESMRSGGMKALREEAAQRKLAVEKLGLEIRQDYAEKRYDVLLPKVQRYVAWRPQDTKAKVLLERLEKRAQKQGSAANSSSTGTSTGKSGPMKSAPATAPVVPSWGGPTATIVPPVPVAGVSRKKRFSLKRVVGTLVLVLVVIGFIGHLSSKRKSRALRSISSPSTVTKYSNTATTNPFGEVKPSPGTTSYSTTGSSIPAPPSAPSYGSNATKPAESYTASKGYSSYSSTAKPAMEVPKVEPAKPAPKYTPTYTGYGSSGKNSFNTGKSSYDAKSKTYGKTSTTVTARTKHNDYYREMNAELTTLRRRLEAVEGPVTGASMAPQIESSCAALEKRIAERTTLPYLSAYSQRSIRQSYSSNLRANITGVRGARLAAYSKASSSQPVQSALRRVDSLLTQIESTMIDSGTATKR